MPEFVFPLRRRPSESYTTGGRRFGASRSSGSRLHAGCDLIAPQGTEILAMADGKVVRGPAYFYSGTYALEVKHTGGKVVRYGEIAKLVPEGVREGATVWQGQVIAKVGRLESGSSMLHLEMYAGTATGPLTQSGNKFMRRSDLIDPTPHLDAAPLYGSDSAPAGAAAPTPATAVTGHVNAKVTSALRVHDAASTGSRTVFSLVAGDVVTIRGEVSGGVYEWGRTDWLEIEHASGTGYAAGYYIDIGPGAAGGDKWTRALRAAKPTGASAETAKQDNLPAGVESSQKMAETDFARIEAIADRFLSAAGKFGIPAALLAALASRESRCGKMLTADGWGDGGNAFGILQIDRRFHTNGSGDPRSLAHIEQAADIVCDNLEKVGKAHSTWADEHLLHGAVVAYNFGVANVQTIAGLDRGSTGNDYGSDVLARAQYYYLHPKLAIFRG